MAAAVSSSSREIQARPTSADVTARPNIETNLVGADVMAKRLKMSRSTFERAVRDGSIPFINTSQGRKYDLNGTIASRLPRHGGIRSKDEIEGDQSKVLFPLFRASTPLDEVVERTGIGPDAVLSLFRKWLLLRAESDRLQQGIGNSNADGSPAR
jgi:excisionase family DNA binding protein